MVSPRRTVAQLRTAHPISPASYQSTRYHKALSLFYNPDTIQPEAIDELRARNLLHVDDCRHDPIRRAWTKSQLGDHRDFHATIFGFILLFASMPTLSYYPFSNRYSSVICDVTFQPSSQVGLKLMISFLTSFTLNLHTGTQRIPAINDHVLSIEILISRNKQFRTGHIRSFPGLAADTLPSDFSFSMQLF